MASPKTRHVHIPSANGSKPPRRPEVLPPADNPKRAAAGKRPKTKAAKTPKVAAPETPLAAVANTAAEPKPNNRKTRRSWRMSSPDMPSATSPLPAMNGHTGSIGKALRINPFSTSMRGLSVG
jgi:hypothetical protein